MIRITYEALDALSRSILAHIKINEVADSNELTNGISTINYDFTTIGTIEKGRDTVNASLFTYDPLVSNSLKDEYFLQATLCKLIEYAQSCNKSYLILDGAEELLNEQRPFWMWECYGYLLTIEGNQLLFQVKDEE